LAGVTAVSMCLLMAVAALAQAAPYYGWTAPPEFQSLTNPIPASAASVGVGQRIFQGRCAPCHGTRGNGEGESADSLRVPPGDLTDKKRMQGYSDGTLFWKIHVGRGEMPPWQLILTEEQIWHVINYIRGFTAKTQ
jgi:mono/diheme cytochrome c family protein